MVLALFLAACAPEVRPRPDASDGDPRCADGPVEDRDGDGFSPPNPRCPSAQDPRVADCDDDRSDVHPGAAERCDGVDQDCDGAIDDDADDPVPWYADVDRDGFGAGAASVGCVAPAGFVPVAGDCDDDDPTVFPGAPEDPCLDTADRDCDGVLPAPADHDGDLESACTDCDDRDASRHAGAAEHCDGVDEDCDGAIDEDAVDVVRFYLDGDGDGFGAAPGTEGCDPAPGEARDGSDCDDEDSDVYPGAPEACDGRATGCGPLPVDEQDRDRDGFLACAGDCDDDDDDTWPGAFDACDGVDQDCDGEPDDDTLGDGPACGADSCMHLAGWRPDRPDGPAWIDPVGEAPREVMCSQGRAGGGWMRCARVQYHAGSDTVTYDTTGAEIGRSPPGSGSALGPDTTRAIARSCFDAADVERGLGVSFLSADGPDRSEFFAFEASLTGWTRLLATTDGDCAGGTVVAATSLEGRSRWLALSDGRRRVTCDGAAARGLWTEPAPDGLWLDLSDDDGDALGTLTGAIGTPRDGVLSVWVRVERVERIPAPLPPTPHEVAVLEVLPTRSCASETPSMSFTEGAAHAGLDYVAPWVPVAIPEERTRDRHVGGGVLVVDLTGDAVPDVVFTAPWGPTALYVNDGAGAFTHVPDAGLEPPGRVLNVTAADLDDDGLRDVVLGGSLGVFPFRNLGDGRFAAEEALWLAPSDERSTAVAWTDFDGDGWLDAYLGSGPECTHPAVDCRARDVILRGTGPFTFEDVSARFGRPEDREGFALVASWFDVDHDGDLDAWVGNDGGSWNIPNKAFANPGTEGAWPEVAASVGLGSGIASMGLAIGDVDDTGDTTVYVSNVFNQIESRSTPGGTFVSAGTTATYPSQPISPGFMPAAWATELADLDHDGDLDAIVAWGWLMPKSWWANDRTQAGLAAVTTPMPSVIAERRAGAFVRRPDLLADAPASWMWRSAAPVDIDADGTLDVLLSSSMGPVSLQRGACTPGHWLEVSPRQTGGNRDALGARVEVWSDHHDGWRLIGVGGTGAHSGREPVAHFGLGVDTVAGIRVRWPDGVVSVIRDVPADQRVRVVR